MPEKNEKEIGSRKKGLGLDGHSPYGEKHKSVKERYKDALAVSEKVDLIAELLGLE